MGYTARNSPCCGGRSLLAVLAMIAVQTGFGAYSVVLSIFAKSKLNATVFSLFRDLCCFPILLVAAFCLEGVRVPRKRDLGLFFLLGLTGIYGNQILFILGLYQAGADIASIFQPSIPVLTVVLAIATCQELPPVLIPGCRLGATRPGAPDGRSLASGWLKAGGVVTVAVGGILMVVFNPKHKSGGTGNPHLGMVLLLGNCLCMAAYVLIQKKYIFKNASPTTWRTHPVNVTAWSYLFGAMFMALTSMYYVATDASAFNVMPRDLSPCRPSPAAHDTGITTEWCEAHSGAHWNSTVEALCVCDRVDIGSFLVPISYAAFISSAMCYGLITYANKHLPSTVVTAFWPLQVPVAVVLEYFATSGADSLSLGQGAGAAIIALALLMVTYSNHLEAQRADAAAGSESTDLSAHLLGESKESGALKVQVHGVGEKGY